MHKENFITIQAPLGKLFETAADLSLWPKILPHYRWVRFLEQSPTRNVVKMAARRKWIPVQWTSEHTVDRTTMQLRFHHLKSFTRGMSVVWTFTPKSDGVEVRIRHDLQSRFPFFGEFFAQRIIGDFFVGYIANQTLRCMKQYVERMYGS
jgi:ribosome-associated toxin RatA of RatAB toxin-antitoxin module